MSRSRMLVAAMVLFLLESHDLLLFLPRLRALEGRICQDHFRPTLPNATELLSTPINEQSCKIAPVQSRLATLRGWQVFFDAIPTILLSTVWGYIADRTGKPLVLVVNSVGNILYAAWFFLICFRLDTLPLELVWLSSAGYVLGGGPRFASSLALAMVADGGQESQRSQRLYYTYSAFLLSELVAPFLGARAMDLSIWINIVLSLLSLTAGAVLALGMSLYSKDGMSESLSPATGGETAAPAPNQAGPSGTPVEGEDSPDTAGAQKLASYPITHLQDLVRRLRGMLRHPSFGFATTIIWLGFLICPVRQILVFEILIPLASQRFGLKISQTGFIIPMVASTNLVLFLLVIPRITQFLRRKGSFSSFRADLTVVKASLACLVMGCVGIGLAASYEFFLISIVVYASGFCVRLGLLALQTALLDPAVIGEAFGFVTTLEALGGMFEGVIFQKVFALGIRRGRDWMAAPFWIGAVIYLAYMITLLAVQEPRSGAEDQQPLLEDGLDENR